MEIRRFELKFIQIHENHRFQMKFVALLWNELKYMFSLKIIDFHTTSLMSVEIHGLALKCVDFDWPPNQDTHEDQYMDAPSCYWYFNFI